MSEIKPCPFCGESKDLWVGRSTENREGWPTYVYCRRCGARGPWVYVKREAMWSWAKNSRMIAKNTGWNERMQNECRRHDASW